MRVAAANVVHGGARYVVYIWRNGARAGFGVVGNFQLVVVGACAGVAIAPEIVYDFVRPSAVGVVTQIQTSIISRGSHIAAKHIYQCDRFTDSEAHILQMLDLFLEEEDLLREMCACILRNRSAGLYDGAYKTVQLAMELRDKSEETREMLPK